MSRFLSNAINGAIVTDHYGSIHTIRGVYKVERHPDSSEYTQAYHREDGTFPLKGKVEFWEPLLLLSYPRDDFNI